MPVSLWPVEGSIYPMLDASGMRVENNIRKVFEIGEGYRASIFFRTKTSFDLHRTVDSDDIKIGIRFLDSKNKPFYGMDIDKNNLKHSHLASGNQTIKEHIPLSGNHTLAEFVSESFERVKEVFQWKFPEIKIRRGSDFVGVA